MSANPCPDVDLQWMFWLWLPFCWLTELLVTCASILLKGNGALVAENDVKCIAGIDGPLCVLQPLCFIHLLDHLAVLGAL